MKKYFNASYLAAIFLIMLSETAVASSVSITTSQDYMEQQFVSNGSFSSGLADLIYRMTLEIKPTSGNFQISKIVIYNTTSIDVDRTYYQIDDINKGKGTISVLPNRIEWQGLAEIPTTEFELGIYASHPYKFNIPFSSTQSINKELFDGQDVATIFISAKPSQNLKNLEITTFASETEDISSQLLTYTATSPNHIDYSSPKEVRWEFQNVLADNTFSASIQLNVNPKKVGAVRYWSYTRIEANYGSYSYRSSGNGERVVRYTDTVIGDVEIYFVTPVDYRISVNGEGTYYQRFREYSEIVTNGEPTTIKVNDNFKPGVRTVATGTTVTWINEDQISHTIVGNTGLFSSHSLEQYHQYSYTFNKSGIYEYSCSYHPSMKGIVNVVNGTTMDHAASTSTIIQPVEQIPSITASNPTTSELGTLFVDKTDMIGDVYDQSIDITRVIGYKNGDIYSFEISLRGEVNLSQRSYQILIDGESKDHPDYSISTYGGGTTAIIDHRNYPAPSVKLKDAKATINGNKITLSGDFSGIDISNRHFKVRNDLSSSTPPYDSIETDRLKLDSETANEQTKTKDLTPESMAVPAAVAVGTTVMLGAAASTSGGSVLNAFGNYWRKLEEMVREFLKIGGKFAYEEVEEKIISGALKEEKEAKEPEDKGELKKLIIAGGIIFTAFTLELYLHSHELKYDVSPIVFLTALAFFAMIAEIGHDLAIKLSLKTAGGKSVFELSLIGVPVTIVSGLLGFVITAAGATRILHKFTNPLTNAIVASFGSLFNLILGLLLLFISVSFHIEWLAFAGAMPNLANAAFSLFPTYPFEGRRVFHGSKALWGLLFFSSMMFYTYVVL